MMEMIISHMKVLWVYIMLEYIYVYMCVCVRFYIKSITDLHVHKSIKSLEGR